jgi:hypothetical protein
MGAAAMKRAAVRACLMAIALAATPSLAADGDTQTIVMFLPHGGERTIVVARQVAVEERDPCAGDPDCVSLDSAYRATYDLVQVLHGDAPPARFEFDMYSHYGLGQFAYQRTAMLVLLKREGRYVLEKYQGAAVDPTVDGRWAMCAHDGEDAEPDEFDAPIVPIEFAASVVFDDVERWPARQVEREYPAPTFERRGTRVYCTRGVYVEDLATSALARLRARDADPANQ